MAETRCALPAIPIPGFPGFSLPGFPALPVLSISLACPLD